MINGYILFTVFARLFFNFRVSRLPFTFFQIDGAKLDPHVLRLIVYQFVSTRLHSLILSLNTSLFNLNLIGSFSTAFSCSIWSTRLLSGCPILWRVKAIETAAQNTAEISHRVGSLSIVPVTVLGVATIQLSNAYVVRVTTINFTLRLLSDIRRSLRYTLSCTPTLTQRSRTPLINGLLIDEIFAFSTFQSLHLLVVSSFFVRQNTDINVLVIPPSR